MNLTSNIVVGLLASIVGGVISGILIIRKITHDTKRQYARQISSDFSLMSMLLFMSARSYLESLGYSDQGFDAYQPDMDEKAMQLVVKQIRNEDHDQRLLKCDIPKLTTIAEDITETVLHDPTGFKCFFSKYPLQASYFDVLYQVSSAIDLIIFWRDEMPKQVNDIQRRICVRNVTIYLLDALDGLLKASLEIKYYSKAKAWTWRLFLPTIRS